MTIVETHKGFEVSFPFDYNKVKEVKSITGSWFNGKSKVWVIPKQREYEVEMLKKKYGITEESYAGPAENYDLVPELPELDITLDLPRTLFPFQTKGVAYNRIHKKVIIGDQPGLGKTTTAIATIVSLTAFPCLIICPATLKLNWQKEWMDVAGKKSMILDDRVKNTWHQYHRVGMIDVFIVNYESLKKYFVQPGWNKPKDAPFKLKDIPFRETTTLFKCVVIDESHKCFPYETKVLTNKGLILIGEIVENIRKDLLVASFNHEEHSVTFKPIANFWRNDLHGRKLFKIKHNKGELYATENHKIFTSSGRYKILSEIKSGEDLYLLREDFLNNEEWQNNGGSLLQKLCLKDDQCGSGSKSQNGLKQKATTHRKNMRLVRNNFFYEQKGLRSNEKILLSELQCQMEDENSGSNRAESVSYQKTKIAGKPNQINGRPGKKKKAFRSYDFEQPNVQFGNIGKDESGYARKNISFQRRKRAFNHSSKITSQSIGTGRNGTCYKNSTGKRSISKFTQSLQSRYSSPEYNVSDRSGWAFPQYQEMEISGPAQNRNIECVRVESIEVYQPTSPEQYGFSSIHNQIVYDLEIDDNHNFFADGILVSNCKDGTTQQSKFVMGITKDKEYVFELTGTPVVNKPKDLIPQLIVLNRLNDIVSHIPDVTGRDRSGYKRFINRYCGGGTGMGATNLKELNYRLNSLCFYRREKSEVLKDLPAKLRQVVLCEIDNRTEYHKAESEFVDYLKTVRGCTDTEIRRKLRGEVMVKMGILKQISARGKIESVQDHVDEIVDSGEKVVVFCTLREIGDKLKEIYPGAVMIRGGMSDQEKDHSVTRFQKDPNTKIIICSIKAAGVGLTLTASSRVVFVEFPWTFADCEQCEDRTHRIGQNDSVQCAYFLGENTIDRYCYELIQKKKSIAQTITGAADDVAEEVIDELLNLFNQK